jgi:hypothetical protein
MLIALTVEFPSTKPGRSAVIVLSLPTRAAWDQRARREGQQDMAIGRESSRNASGPFSRGWETLRLGWALDASDLATELGCPRRILWKPSRSSVWGPAPAVRPYAAMRYAALGTRSSEAL